MSLINDALKQTKRAQPKTSPSIPPPLPPVQSSSQEGLGWLVPGIVVLLVIAASVLIGLSLFKPKPLAASALPTAHPVPLAAVPAPSTQKVASVASVPAVMTNTSPSNVVAVVPPKPPEPKLQGILFAATRPCAIVSGKTVFVGDRINDFRVAAIAKDHITLQSATGTKVLSLNPQ